MGACCLGCCASAIASCCANMCCSSLNQCKSKRGVGSRMPYMVLMWISCLFAVIMSLYGENELYRNKTFKVSLRACNNANCRGNGAVYRVSFTLFLFFLIHAIITKFWMPFHWEWLKFKLLFFVIFLVCMFFVPSDFFVGYAEFARVASVLFLVLQVIVILLWAMETSDNLQNYVIQVTEKVQNDDFDEDEDPEHEMKVACGYRVILLGGTLAMLAFCITIWVMSFFWFGNNGAGCEGKETLVGITIVLVVFLFVATFFAKHGSIFTTAVVSCYITYLMFSGLSATKGKQCNDFAKNNDDTAMWLGICVTALSLSYVGFSVSKNFSRVCWEDDGEEEEMQQSVVSSGGGGGTSNDGVDLEADSGSGGGGTADSNYDDLDEDTDKSKRRKKKKDGDEDTTQKELTDDDPSNFTAAENNLEQRQNVLFHACMLLAGIYISMLYTNWATGTASKHTARGRGNASLAVNISAQYLTFFLYSWTLVAPIVMPNRFKHLNGE